MASNFIIYKPFRVLSQFTSAERKKTLKDYFAVPPDVYPVGRLDYDSEGLLILSSDKKLNYYLLNPVNGHEREYWVQVEGIFTSSAKSRLQNGVAINVDGSPYQTKKCKAEIFETPPHVAGRFPPVRFRKTVPDSWIKIILTEGKNRQVRKMTAAVGFPTLRLIRWRVEKISLGQMQPGEMKSVTTAELYNLLRIPKK